MEKHYQLTDEEFVEQFENLIIEPENFTHEAHLRLAWIHIKKYGVRQAIENLRNQIRHFASFHGDHDKYHETITIAAVRAVYHFILKSSSVEFESFIKEFPQLKYKLKELLSCHYSREMFQSELAKKEFVPPDLAAFDPLGR